MKLSEQLHKNGNFKLAEQAKQLEDDLVETKAALSKELLLVCDLSKDLVAAGFNLKQAQAEHDSEIAQLKALVEQARNLLRQI